MQAEAIRISEQNVEIVRNVYAMLDRGDADLWDRLLPADFVFDFSQRLADPTILRRDEARAEYDRGRHEFFEEGRVGWEPKELIDAGDNVVAFSRISGRGKTGEVVSTHTWGVWTFRDGKPVKWTYFGFHRSEALEAAGLSE